ncbi:MAG: THUMP domain-containing class I SAM-dependent RNA methyltransferase [Hyphomicrobium sp.]
MTDANADTFEIFLVCAPGLEKALFAEAREAGFASARYVPGGVTMTGGWPAVWRANLVLRGPSRVLARVARFRADQLSTLNKRTRRVDWASVLRADVPVRVEATCARSAIYHSGAAAERIGKAISNALGAPLSDDAGVLVKARIEDDVVTLSVDASGELLHKRGYKEAVNAAPMRENMAALFLRQCGYAGKEPLLDPMCGSGTFVIEAAEIAAALAPGRARSFAFEQLATFDAAAWREMRAAIAAKAVAPAMTFTGSDRDAAAIAISRANAERAGVSAFVDFKQHAVSALEAPAGPPGLVIVNPPYGGRLGEAAKLTALYRALGQTLTAKFSGWRVGLVTTNANLARATRLPFLPADAPVAHGGLRVTLYRTGPLP